MKKVLLPTLFVLFLSANAIGQETAIDSAVKTMPSVVRDEDIVFTKVEQEAEFTGGTPAWSEYLSKKLGSFEPARNGAPRGKYSVLVKFIVSKTGEVSAIAAETKYGYGMEQAVIKVIKESPKWLPARQNGRLVNAYRRQPVTFIVE
jgi:periplasmic protein TonB